MTFLTESWFWRGTQSAIFYYLSCAPCTKLSERRKKKKETKRAIADREKEGNFQQALPSTTNPGWDEEIGIGPGPPPKRLGKKETRKRDVLRAKMLESMNMDPSIKDEQSRINTGTTSMETTDSQPISQGLDQPIEPNWNRRRYQREDEILWGQDLEAGSSSSRACSPMSRTSSGAGSHYYARNPEVNDLHPPVVSAFSTSPIDTRWMLQPPPKAKIMEGKEPTSRSRSGSGTSHGSSQASRSSSKRGRNENLGRSIGERLLEEKLARGEIPPSAMSASSPALSRGGSHLSFVSSTSSPTAVAGLTRARTGVKNTVSNDSLRVATSVRARTSTSLSQPSTDCYDMAPLQPTRPPLKTIMSTSNEIPHATANKASPQKNTLPPLHITRSSASSLEMLQIVVPLSYKPNHTQASNLEHARRVTLPLTPQEENHDAIELKIEEWDPATDTAGGWHFPLPTMELASGHRWSMDI